MEPLSAIVRGVHAAGVVGARPREPTCPLGRFRHRSVVEVGRQQHRFRHTAELPLVDAIALGERRCVGDRLPFGRGLRLEDRDLRGDFRDLRTVQAGGFEELGHVRLTVHPLRGRAPAVERFHI